MVEGKRFLMSFGGSAMFAGYQQQISVGVLIRNAILVAPQNPTNPKSYIFWGLTPR
jgi:hypothetical protein